MTATSYSSITALFNEAVNAIDNVRMDIRILESSALRSTDDYPVREIEELELICLTHVSDARRHQISRIQWREAHEATIRSTVLNHR